jgi:phosphocarrier protein
LTAGNPNVRDVVIQNVRGLHARAAAKFVKLAAEFDARVEVSKSGQSVSGESIMGLMMLAASTGSTIHMSATGRQATEALDALCQLVNEKFYED